MKEKRTFSIVFWHFPTDDGFSNWSIETETYAVLSLQSNNTAIFIF